MAKKFKACPNGFCGNTNSGQPIYSCNNCRGTFCSDCQRGDVCPHCDKPLTNSFGFGFKAKKIGYIK